jgi:hypothetical protein
MANCYEKMTDKDFSRILEDVLNEETGGSLLSIPGLYEVVSEYFNNEVLSRWEDEQDES